MKLSRVIEVALNGDAPNVDPAVRRALYAMGDELDEQAEAYAAALQSEVEKMTLAINVMGHDMRGVRRLVLGTTATVLGGVVVGIANILIQL